MSHTIPKWAHLNHGDLVDVIAPAYGGDDDLITEAKQKIEAMGFRENIPNNLFEDNLLQYSNTQEYRLNHLIKAFQNKNSKVIFPIRGGRGTSPLLIDIEKFEPFRSGPIKLIIGFSDITALHLLVNSWGWPSLHSGGLKTYSLDSYLLPLASILRGEVEELTFTGFKALNEKAIQTKTIKDCVVVGGNLSVIQRNIGTPTCINADGKILLLEDTDEEATKTWEHLAHLERAGLLDNVVAIIVGEFQTGITEKEAEKYSGVEEMFAKRMQQKGIPVIKTNQFGHGPVNNPIFFNTPTQLEINEKGIMLKVKTNN